LNKVLITGCNGQDGIILSNLFLKKNYKVFGFVKSKKRVFKKVKYFINNLKTKKKIISHLKIIQPDIIIHLASSNNSYGDRKKKDNYKINYLENFKNTKNLVNAIIACKFKTKFIFAGSSLMFKSYKNRKIKENFKLVSKDYYGKYKVDSHNYIMQVKKKFNLNACTAILFNHDSKFRNKKFLLPKLINSFKLNDHRYIKKIYNLNISGDFSHAEDICNGIFKISVCKMNVDKIILSSGKRTYINKIILFLKKNFSSDVILKKKSNLKNKNSIGSNQLAKQLLNYKVNKNYLIACRELVKTYL
jgi:GDP-D-mannose dehydratase